MRLAHATGNRKSALRIWAAVAALILPLGARAQISLSTAVALAEKSSPGVRAAAADVRKANAELGETRDAYIPNLVFGANPGYVYGYPLGYPSLFQANSQSLVFSSSQRDYIRAARAAVKAANLRLKDTQQEAALDVALDYVELNHDLEEIAALNEETGYARDLVQTEQQRVLAGVDPRLSELQAELRAAQVEEKRVDLENDADEMREKLGHLTGLPAEGLNTVSSSVPALPDLSQGDDTESTKPGAANPGTAAAYENAKSKFYEAFGDARQNYRPTVSFGGQYSLFEKFANYQQYFPYGLQYNNAAVGVVITFPLFDASRRTKAAESEADALHAQADADAARDVLSEQTLEMRRSIRELAAQQRVAQIQSELAQEQLKTVESELTNGTGAANVQPVSPIAAQQAHIEERERYEDMLDAKFSLMKVELNLLRATGQITSWVESSLKQPGS